MGGMSTYWAASAGGLSALDATWGHLSLLEAAPLLSLLLTAQAVQEAYHWPLSV